MVEVCKKKLSVFYVMDQACSLLPESWQDHVSVVSSQLHNKMRLCPLSRVSLTLHEQFVFQAMLQDLSDMDV